MNSVMTSIFRDFDEYNIRYLHFKSNTNLTDSFAGKGDFDILVDPSAMAEAEAIMARHSGKRFNPPRLGRYPGVDNWLVLDENTGVLYHIHLHYQLATGKPLVKDYIIPWNELMFDTRVRDREYDIYITDPALELLLLIVRTVVKSSVRQQVKAAIGRYSMSRSMLKEYGDLKDKVSPERFNDIAIRSGFDEKEIRILNNTIEHNEIDSAIFRELSGMVRRHFKISRRMMGFEAFVLSLYYTQRRKISQTVRNRFGKCIVIKKVHDTKGLIVAFVGVDGAGKSTMTREITRWLGGKVDCKQFYMGSGDGKVPLSVRLLKTIKKKRNNNASSDGRKHVIREVSLYRNPVKYMKRMCKMHALLAVQKNNNRNIRRMNRYRSNGGISLLDRYPQIEYPDRNDGPKIAAYRESFVQKRPIDRMIKKEAEQLDIVRNIKPDIFFRLNISAETSMDRKPEQTDIEGYRRKIEELHEITFQNANIIDIDAEQPYEQELLQIKRILWSLM